jgi:hypothetical protein
MQISFPFRHRIATISVVVDIAVFALMYIIPLYVVSIDNVLLDSSDYLLYFGLIDIWGWFHIPVVLLPISSSVICHEGCHVIGIIRNTVHIVLCFSQTYIVFYMLGFLLEKKNERGQRKEVDNKINDKNHIDNSKTKHN